MIAPDDWISDDEFEHAHERYLEQEQRERALSAVERFELGDEPARCNGCRKTPFELPEYEDLARAEQLPDALSAVIREEGTYNPANGHFWCTSCYIAAGMPLGKAK